MCVSLCTCVFAYLWFTVRNGGSCASDVFFPGDIKVAWNKCWCQPWYRDCMCPNATYPLPNYWQHCSVGVLNPVWTPKPGAGGTSLTWQGCVPGLWAPPPGCPCSFPSATHSTGLGCILGDQSNSPEFGPWMAGTEGGKTPFWHFHRFALFS